jgi:hypothetical protein
MMARISVAVMVGVFTVFGVSGCSTDEKVGRMYEDVKNPDGSQSPLTDEQKIKLVDSFRSEGSFEAARDRLTDTAQSIAEQVTAAVPGQTWKFADGEYAREAYTDGSLCERLDPPIARRPKAKPIDFGATFSADGFKAAATIVRQEAAKYGATTETSLFNESSKREYDVQGSGYEFRILQINTVGLDITGDCHLFQKIIDMPPGRLPPEPPIVPTAP